MTVPWARKPVKSARHAPATQQRSSSGSGSSNGSGSRHNDTHKAPGRARTTSRNSGASGLGRKSCGCQHFSVGFRMGSTWRGQAGGGCRSAGVLVTRPFCLAATNSGAHRLRQHLQRRLQPGPPFCLQATQGIVAADAWSGSWPAAPFTHCAQRDIPSLLPTCSSANWPMLLMTSICSLVVLCST